MIRPKHVLYLIILQWWCTNTKKSIIECSHTFEPVSEGDFMSTVTCDNWFWCLTVCILQTTGRMYLKLCTLTWSYVPLILSLSISKLDLTFARLKPFICSFYHVFGHCPKTSWQKVTIFGGNVPNRFYYRNIFFELVV